MQVLSPRLSTNAAANVLGLLTACLLASCQWVDSTGAQSQTEPALKGVIPAQEEVRLDLDFSTLDKSFAGPIVVESWEAISQGKLAECSAYIDTDIAANSLGEACSADETLCELTVIPGTDATGEIDRQQISILPPRLSVPIGMKYRWYLLDSDGEPQSHETTLCIEAVNNDPVANNDEYTVQADNKLVIEGADFDVNCKVSQQNNSLIANDTDDHHLAKSCVTAQLVGLPLYASNDFTAAFTDKGRFEYLPDDASPHAIDSFSYRLFDGQNYSSPATVTIRIQNEALQPDANNDVFNVAQNSELTYLYPLANDTDNSNTLIEIVEIPSEPNRGGSAEISQGIAIAYQPSPGFRGNETLSYTISNGYGFENTATITVRVR